MYPIYTKFWLPGNVALAFATMDIERREDNPKIDWKKLLFNCNIRDAVGCLQCLNSASQQKYHSDNMLQLATLMALQEEFHKIKPIKSTDLDIRYCTDTVADDGQDLFNLTCNYSRISIDTSEGIDETLFKLLEKHGFDHFNIRDCRESR